MNPADFQATVRLSLQIALLGMITPNIRAITCGWDSITINVKFIYDGDFSDNDADLAEEVASEVISSFPDYMISTKCISVPSPSSFNEELLSHLVYRRREE